MDLKDVVESVQSDSKEAMQAINAGHPDTAEEYLCSIENTVGNYIRENTSPAGDVTESATSEKPAETLKATPAKPPGPDVHPAAVVPADGPSKVLPASQFVKPNQ